MDSKFNLLPSSDKLNTKFPRAIALAAILFSSSFAFALIGGTTDIVPALVRIPELECSAVVLNKRTLLTAGHCVLPGQDREPKLQEQSSFSIQVYGKDKNLSDAILLHTQTVTAKAIQVHPRYASWYNDMATPLATAIQSGAVLDLAILKTNEDIDTVFGVAQIPDKALSANPDSMIITGTGCAEIETPDDPTLYAKYAESTNVALRTRTVVIKGNQSDETISLCLGDSGGPMYDPETLNDAGGPVVYGINSNFSYDKGKGNQQSNLNMTSTITRTDIFEARNWIQRRSKTASENPIQDIKEAVGDLLSQR
jgi:hypothetical protein